MICPNCTAERTAGEPCPECKFQPYEENDADLVAKIAAHEPTSEEIDKFEICPTPPELALAICRRLQEQGVNPTYILEPSAGEGAFVSAAQQTWPGASITAVEIRTECHDALRAAGADFAISASLEDARASGVSVMDLSTYDLVLGNPPFSLAEAHIRLLLGGMKPGAMIAFLLKTGFYESHERVPFWRDFPEATMAPLVPRPGFKLNRKGKKGTDSQAYGLFTWIAGLKLVPQRAPHLVWREQIAKRGRGRPRKVALEVAAPVTPAPVEELPLIELE